MSEGELFSNKNFPHSWEQARGWLFADQILPCLYLGGKNSASNKAHLFELGIKYVVNCTLDVPNYFPDEFEYHNVHIDDVATENIYKHFDQTLEYIDSKQKQGHPILVHCVAGVSRSATIVLAYLMQYHKHRLRSAFELVKSKRPRIYPNIGFWRQLIEFEKKLYDGHTTVSLPPKYPDASMIEFLPLPKL